MVQMSKGLTIEAVRGRHWQTAPICIGFVRMAMQAAHHVVDCSVLWWVSFSLFLKGTGQSFSLVHGARIGQSSVEVTDLECAKTSRSG